jgi:hypothetical protein
VYTALVITRMFFDYWMTRNPAKLRI